MASLARTFRFWCHLNFVSEPLAYLITFSCYGTHLRGGKPGWSTGTITSRAVESCHRIPSGLTHRNWNTNPFDLTVPGEIPYCAQFVRHASTGIGCRLPFTFVLPTSM